MADDTTRYDLARDSLRVPLLTPFWLGKNEKAYSSSNEEKEE
jgi:hypothetical protein